MPRHLTRAAPDLSTVSDAELSRRLRDGEPDALAIAYARHGAALMTLAVRLLGDRTDAEDVLHDLFVGLPEAMRSYEERGQLGPWLKRIVVRLALRKRRAATRRGEVPIDDMVRNGAEEAIERDVDAVLLRQAIESLPGDMRDVLILKLLEGFSHREIAGLLDISPGASEVRLTRALKLLRATVNPRP
jgi:RNA polymerase sigma factor (sigma-70 family)